MTKKSYSLSRRVMLFYLIPLMLFCFIIVMYLNLYEKTVMQMANRTFQNMADNRQEQMLTQINGIRSFAQTIAYSPTVQSYLLEQNESKKVTSYQQTQEYMRALSESQPNIISAYAFMENRSSINMGDGFIYAYDQVLMDMDVQTTLKRNSAYFTELYPLRKHDEKNNRYGVCLYAALPLNISNPLNTNRIVSAVFYDAKAFLNSSDPNDDTIEVLFVGGEAAFFTTDQAITLSALCQVQEQQTTFRINKREYHLRLIQLIEENDMCYAYLVAQDSLVRDTEQFKTLSLLIIAFCAVIFTLFIFTILKSTFQPIKKLASEVSKMQRTDHPIGIPRARELTVLAHTINDMSVRINQNVRKEMELNERNLALQVQKNRMEIQAFRHQINPHFLFNTLECAIGMLRYYGVEPVTNLIMNLSACFHYTLYSPMMVPLSEEIAHLTHYLDIMEERFPGKYQFVKLVEDALSTIEVPSLLLQPLAENAIKHGFEAGGRSTQKKLTLRVWTDTQEDTVTIQIVDNGVGMTPEKLANVLGTMHRTDYVEKHISLNNVYRRLQLLYGRECMTIKSKPGYYTSISVSIPFHSDANRSPPLPTPADDMHRY